MIIIKENTRMITIICRIVDISEVRKGIQSKKNTQRTSHIFAKYSHSVFFFFNLYWSIIALQCCISFC